jgi:hypothetical protein
MVPYHSSREYSNVHLTSIDTQSLEIKNFALLPLLRLLLLLLLLLLSYCILLRSTLLLLGRSRNKKSPFGALSGDHYYYWQDMMAEIVLRTLQ